ncbi:hypothetical protein CHL78_011410 [Romboutsia weinsteinii]|uniref:Uncharacterized protein n=1 Tax=Romboutsia weinsteinii TaxID=2020949 RepID=A0A371J2Q2_9FIRM|nr:hypothetical protein [Romboutsia weinsteinii]RDY26936.1 hypothetical protein CHL78_011410 [Romboutsia weinsteinii]
MNKRALIFWAVLILICIILYSIFLNSGNIIGAAIVLAAMINCAILLVKRSKNSNDDNYF